MSTGELSSSSFGDDAGVPDASVSSKAQRGDMAIELVHLSNVINRPLVDRDGDRLGRLQDLIVRVGESPHPAISGAVIKVAGRELFVPIRKISELGEKRVRYDGKRVDLRRFERRPGELLLGQDLLAHHLINMVGGRLIRANEIELSQVDGTWEVFGVDPTTKAALRRVLPGFLGKHIKPGLIVDWASIEPFVAHVPTARLRIPYRKLARLKPQQIADLVEAASPEEGEEIIDAVGADQELEADVFEELDPEHRLEFVTSRSDADAARLLSRMAPDDAADVIMQVDQERRLPILTALPEPQQHKVRNLLSYNPETAGGLMSPDFLAVSEKTPVSQVLAAIRSSTAPLEALDVVFGLDDGGKLSGAASVVSVVRADPDAPLSSVEQADPAHVHADWDVNATLRKMSDYNLTVAPVLDTDHQELLGVVTVDDLLETLLPSGWRRDYGPTEVEQ